MSLRAIYYDTETTGVRYQTDRIIEIAAYDAHTKRSFCEFINPEMPIPPEATNIHHITDDMVKNAPAFGEVGRKFIEFVGENFVLIAHNNDRFDKLFLEESYKRANIDLPDWQYVDSLTWARKYRPDLPKHSLQYLREVYDVPSNQAHRALDDVMVLYNVFSRMTCDLPIETIIGLLSEKRKVEYMPFGKYQGKALAEVPKSYIGWLSKNQVFDKEENKPLKAAFEKLGLLEGATT